jgi:hypothetical protein
MTWTQVTTVPSATKNPAPGIGPPSTRTVQARSKSSSRSAIRVAGGRAATGPGAPGLVARTRTAARAVVFSVGVGLSSVSLPSAGLPRTRPAVGAPGQDCRTTPVLRVSAASPLPTHSTVSLPDSTANLSFSSTVVFDGFAFPSLDITSAPISPTGSSASARSNYRSPTLVIPSADASSVTASTLTAAPLGSRAVTTWTTPSESPVPFMAPHSDTIRRYPITEHKGTMTLRPHLANPSRVPKLLRRPDRQLGSKRRPDTQVRPGYLHEGTECGHLRYGFRHFSIGQCLEPLGLVRSSSAPPQSPDPFPGTCSPPRFGC